MLFFDKTSTKTQRVKKSVLAAASAIVIFGLLNCNSAPKQPETVVGGNTNVAGGNTNVAANMPANVNTVASNILASVEIPLSYKTNCAECHGDKGQGIKASPELTGLTTREEDRRSDEDLLGILNNPKSFGLSSKMKSYKDKLTEDEKQEIIRWIKALK
jgi:mono/diheme cytochrome c family protein